MVARLSSLGRFRSVVFARLSAFELTIANKVPTFHPTTIMLSCCLSAVASYNELGCIRSVVFLIAHPLRNVWKPSDFNMASKVEP
jgi:hypothetical protein